MSKTRIKTPAAAILSREEMEKVVGEIAHLQSKRQQVTGEMNEEVTKLRRQFEVQLVGIDEDLEWKLAVAKDWADRNQAEFGAKKSLAMTHGEVGWRIGNPSLKTLTGWTWDRVLEKLREGGWFSKYLRVKQEVNKEQIIADRVELGESLKSIGVRVVQAETFFIEPRIVTPDTRMQEAA
jgi:phage host-nuclease inhibitor protein Gam